MKSLMERFQFNSQVQPTSREVGQLEDLKANAKLNWKKPVQVDATIYTDFANEVKAGYLFQIPALNPDRVAVKPIGVRPFQNINHIFIACGRGQQDLMQKIVAAIYSTEERYMQNLEVFAVPNGGEVVLNVVAKRDAQVLLSERKDAKSLSSLWTEQDYAEAQELLG